MPANVDVGPGPVCASLPAALKRATQGPHRELERRLPVMAPDLTLDRYVALLAAFYGFYRPLEEALAPIATGMAGIAWPHRRKADLLRRDLTALGVSDPALAGLPLCRALPPVSTAAAVCGCLYVLEGATLGGQVIHRQLQATLQLGPASGASFFAGYGPATGRMWQAFLDQLQRVEPVGHPRAIAAAVATFATFSAWLDARGVLT